MTFINAKTKKAFAKSPTLLQVQCAIFDSFLMQHHCEPQIIDIHQDDGGHIVGVSCQDIEREALIDVVIKMNLMFQRVDQTLTFSLESDEIGLVSVYASKVSHLSRLI